MTTTLTRWNPLRELDELQSRILSAFKPAVASRSNGDETMTLSDWTPLADIAEDDKEYIITAELPDVKKDDVKVMMENGILTIAGERKFEREEKNKKWHRVERSYGGFSRSFALPNNGDAANVSAEFKDGMLKVRVAKSEAARPKQIEVKVL